MAQFYATMAGKSGCAATRTGSKRSGLEVAAMSFEGVIKTRLWHDAKADRDMVEITATPHATACPAGFAHSRLIYSGPVSQARGAVA